MENQPKKLRLEDIKVESFTTSPILNDKVTNEVQGGTWLGVVCWFTQELLELSAAHCSENAPGGCYRGDPAMSWKVGNC